MMVGSVSWAPGEWTDDTAMALALAESIGAHELLNTEDLARRYIDWATHDGKGIGNATSRGLVGARDARDARDQARAHHEAGGLAAGNGTVMRATPIALVAKELEEAVDAAVKDAMLSHGDPVAGVASAALCAALIALREDEEPLVAARTQAYGDPRLTAALDAAHARDSAALGQLYAVAPEIPCLLLLKSRLKRPVLA
jgi:ADP-ribosylglycohydrolase